MTEDFSAKIRKPQGNKPILPRSWAHGMTRFLGPFPLDARGGAPTTEAGAVGKGRGHPRAGHSAGGQQGTHQGAGPGGPGETSNTAHKDHLPLERTRNAHWMAVNSNAVFHLEQINFNCKVSSVRSQHCLRWRGRSHAIQPPKLKKYLNYSHIS